MKYFILFINVLVFNSCDFFNKSKKEEVSKDWQMIEVFADEVDELNEGGYYALYYHRDRPIKDSFMDEDIDNNIIALAVQDKLDLRTSKAIAWVADSKQILLLKTNETEAKKSYKRTYSNEEFTIELNMKFSERIDGMDEEDMLIYSGKMKVTMNKTSQSQEFRVKGGI